MKNILYTLLTASVAVACSSDYDLQMDNTQPIPSGEKTLQTTTLTTLSKEEATKVTGITKCGNSIVLGHGDADYRALSIDLQSQTRQALLRMPRSRQEKTGTITLESNQNGQFSTFNYRTGQLAEVSAISTRSGEANSATVQLPKNQQHIKAVKAGNLIIATGIYKQGRYLLYSPEDKTAEYQLAYPTHPKYPNIQEETKAIIYINSVLKVRPDNQAFICADMFSGNIEFCRIAGNRIEQVKAYCFHNPRVVVNEKARCKVAYSVDNVIGFTDVTVSENRVYAIYSGQTYRKAKEKSQECQKLMVFDWNGNLLNTFDLDTPLSKISYDNAEKAIYGLGHTPDPALVKMAI